MTITISSCSGLYICIFLMFCHPQSNTPQIIKWELWTSQLHVEMTSVLHRNSYISLAPPAEAVHPFSFWDLKSIYEKQNKNTAVLSQQRLFFQMLMLWDYATVKLCARLWFILITHLDWLKSQNAVLDRCQLSAHSPELSKPQDCVRRLDGFY